MKKSIDSFDNFSSEIEQFFKNLALNNDKIWFDENRPFYEKEIKDKLKSFIQRMSDEFTSRNLPYVADSRLSLFRINRDIRFSKNKNPYKTNLGIFFPFSYQPHLLIKDYPLGLYLHYEVNNCFIATGMYNPDSSILKSLRQYISEEYSELLNILNNEKFKNDFPDMFSFNKPLTRLTGYDKNHPAIEILKRKDFTYFGKLEDATFFSKELVKIIIDKSEAGKYYMDYLYNAVY